MAKSDTPSGDKVPVQEVRVAVPKGTVVVVTEPSVRVSEYTEIDGEIIVSEYPADAETIAGLYPASTNAGSTSGKADK